MQMLSKKSGKLMAKKEKYFALQVQLNKFQQSWQSNKKSTILEKNKTKPKKEDVKYSEIASI